VNLYVCGIEEHNFEFISVIKGEQAGFCTSEVQRSTKKYEREVHFFPWFLPIKQNKSVLLFWIPNRRTLLFFFLGRKLVLAYSNNRTLFFCFGNRSTEKYEEVQGSTKKCAWSPLSVMQYEVSKIDYRSISFEFRLYTIINHL
jgi:hypothetical protein